MSSAKQVWTIHGSIDMDKLTIKDVVTDEPNARISATEWYLGDELVRRDVNVNVLRGLDLAASAET